MLENKYTPIKDRLTKKPILLGDFVENEKEQCGTLIWDEYFNRYIIRTVTGGNVYARTYTKIEKLKKNNFDNTSVECRRSPNKKKW